MREREGSLRHCVLPALRMRRTPPDAHSTARAAFLAVGAHTCSSAAPAAAMALPYISDRCCCCRRHHTHPVPCARGGVHPLLLLGATPPAPLLLLLTVALVVLSPPLPSACGLLISALVAPLPCFAASAGRRGAHSAVPP